MFRLESLNCYGDGNCGAVGLRGGQRGGGEPGLNGRERGRYRRGVLRVLRVEAERCREPDRVGGVEIPSSGLRSIGHRFSSSAMALRASIVSVVTANRLKPV